MLKTTKIESVLIDPYTEFFFSTLDMDKLGNNPLTVKLSKLESDLLKVKEDIAP